MKRLLSIAIVGVLLLSLMGCKAANSATGTTEAGDDKKISVVTTIFPEYDWVREIVKGSDNVEVTMLLDNGVDLHSYQPTVEDIMKIASSDVFIYVGGESDGWVEDALSEAVNPNMQVINLLDALGDSVKEEEVVEGMEAEEGEEEEEGPEMDEHVWLSLRNAESLVKVIADAISKVDEANKETYTANADSYIDKLSKLDEEYKTAISGSNKDTVLFGDRFPFRYVVDDYGLKYYAAFVGCSAETEASFETIVFLANKVDELSLNTVLTIEKPNHNIANTIVDNTSAKDQKIMELDSMQSTTSKDVADGKTYLNIMESNLEVLKEALK